MPSPIRRQGLPIYGAVLKGRLWVSLVRDTVQAATEGSAICRQLCDHGRIWVTQMRLRRSRPSVSISSANLLQRRCLTSCALLRRQAIHR